MQEYQHEFWDDFFDLPKIKRMGRRKKNFSLRILSDGVSVSLQYEMKTRIGLEVNEDHLRRLYTNGRIPYILGIDPNVKTFMAVVRHHVDTQKEVSCECSIVLKQRTIVV